MAKSKKSKILASMLAVSTMAVFYATPVMAATAEEKTQNITSDTTVGKTVFDGKVTAHKFGTHNSSFYVEENGNIKGNSLIIGKNGDNAVFKVERNGAVKAANGAFTVDKDGNVTATEFTVGGYNLTDIGEKTAGITQYKNDTTYFKGAVNVEGHIYSKYGKFVIGEDSATYLAKGVLNLGAEDGQTLTADKLSTINSVITDNGEVVSQGDVTSTILDESGEVAGHYSLNSIGKNTAGIERDPVAETTTIEGDFAVNGKDNTFGSANGSFTVDAEDGTFTAAKGAFKVREGVGETVIAGSIISSKDQFGNQGTFNGSNLNLQSADHTRNTSIDAGTAYFVKDGSGTSIDGGDITAETLNGKVIDDLVEGSDIADDLANIGGIERSEGAGDPGTGTTTIENNLKVSGDKINMFGDTGLTFDEGTMNGVNVISVSGNIGFNGSNVHFSYGSDGKTTTLGGLALTVDQIATDVSAIKEKTDHITVDDKGNVTISADDGSSLTVGNGGTSTGQGGQVTTDGDHNVTGDMNVDGSLTVGDTEGSQTIIEDDKVTTGEISADKGNIGNSHFNENGITVGAAGGQHTTITDTTVDATNGYFDNLQADKANIGGVGLEDGTVTADKVVTGNTTLDNEGLNVGGQTSVTADGVNVGGNGGTTVSKDGVSIADKTIISDHDVVINEGTADRVSLSETADRVGNLEQGVSELNNRVGELEDRIDKVGAMAAAIANLRTMGYDPAAPTEVAVGIGQYRDETGAALGLFHYPNRDFMLSLSVSTSGDEVMGGIGATWKFGRKSPEKVAEIKKAQAEADARRAEEAKLAKAEEMKQAAKEAKIKAQQERHAKLAAERAAQAEAAK